MELREATTADVAEIRRIAAASWHAAYDEIIGPEAVDRKIEEWYDPDGLRESVQREAGHFLVAARDEVIGFASGAPSDAEYADAVLPRIYVDPDYWVEGVGTGLLDALTDRLAADGHDDLWLAVLADNDVGVSFYRSRGFEKRERRMVDLAGESAEEFVMVRTL